MSRSGYVDDWDSDEEGRMNCWRGAVKKAIEGKRGQKLLRELRDALLALPKKELIAGELIDKEGSVCALGALGQRKAIDFSDIDTEDTKALAKKFGVARSLVCEIAYENDDRYWNYDGRAKRYEHVLRWIESQIKEEAAGRIEE